MFLTELVLGLCSSYVILISDTHKLQALVFDDNKVRFCYVFFYWCLVGDGFWVVDICVMYVLSCWIINLKNNG